MEALKKALTENKDNLASAYTDFEMDENIQKFVDAVYESANIDMEEYCMSFMKMFDILFQNVNTYHVGNLDEYLLSTRVMLPRMPAYNNHDYDKWLPDYWVMISSLAYEKKKYFSEHFT